MGAKRKANDSSSGSKSAKTALADHPAIQAIEWAKSVVQDKLEARLTMSTFDVACHALAAQAFHSHGYFQKQGPCACMISFLGA